LLHAERGDGDHSRFRRQHQTDREHAILLAAFHDVSHLDEDLFVADVFDLQLVDAPGLDHLHAALRKRLGQCQRRGALGAISVDEVNGEVLVHVRARHLAIGIRKGRATGDTECRASRGRERNN
jgi:hypothetical protein